MITPARPPGPPCPKCGSTQTVRRGRRRNKLQTIQLYKCPRCHSAFSANPARTTYPIRTILNALSLYNQGLTQSQVSNTLARTRRTRVPRRTISSWLSRFGDVCSFGRLREQALKLCVPGAMILSHDLDHRQLYTYRLHRAKLALAGREIPGRKFLLLKAYLEKIPTGSFPHHVFRPRLGMEGLPRSSRLRFRTLPLARRERDSAASILASLALNLARTNRERHARVQDFMLANDSVTVATEVPVYLTGDDIRYFAGKGFSLDFRGLRTPVTGHIDILQLRNGLVHILDYKPGADRVNAVNQLTLYALALASRTRLAVRDFKCAWFDDRLYYEFFPLHAVYAGRPPSRHPSAPLRESR